MLQPDCEPIMQTIQSLAHQTQEIDDRIGALETEALQLNSLQFIVSQRKVDRLVRVKHALQDKWNNAMSEFAICRSAHPAHYHFDRDHVLADDFPMEKRSISMGVIAITQTAINAWESGDANGLASCLSDDVVCQGFLPQPVDKKQYIDFMSAVMLAFPDWSFNEHVLDEAPFRESSQRVFYVTRITGTHTNELILPDLPVIPATGTKIALPLRHLEYIVTDNTIKMISADFTPNALEEILAQLGMVLP
jgi:hypothetical protein